MKKLADFIPKLQKKKMKRKDWEKALDAFKELPPPTIEHRDECFHRHLEKIVDNDLYYQCTECKTVIMIVGCAMYRPDALFDLCFKLTEKLVEGEVK